MYFEGRKLDKGDIYLLDSIIIGVLIREDSEKEDYIKLLINTGEGVDVGYKYLTKIIKHIEGK